MKQPDIIIGIDPDVDKNGVAFINTKDKQVIVRSAKFSTLLILLDLAKKNAEKEGQSLTVVVEASWLISHNWHTTKSKAVGAIAKEGYNVGRNHEVGLLIVEYCKETGLNCIERLPLKKCWKGPNGKITHEEITQFVPGLPKQTNSEERDALLLAWNEANLPIRVKI